jgi:membrane associated rhomboid family serine protease
MLPLGIEYDYSETPWATIGIIALCAAVFVLQLGADHEAWLPFMLQPDRFAPWQWITSTVMHADLWHLGGNMLFLFVYGRYLEERLGWARYLGLYAALGVGASLVYWLVSLGGTTPALGASGAISGLMGAVLVAAPRARVKVIWRFYAFHVPAYLLLGVWLLEQFAIGAIGDSGIAVSAHLGGFALGAIAAAIMRAPRLDGTGWYLDPALSSHSDQVDRRQEAMWEAIARHHTRRDEHSPPDSQSGPTWDGGTDARSKPTHPTRRLPRR